MSSEHAVSQSDESFVLPSESCPGSSAKSTLPSKISSWRENCRKAPLNPAEYARTVVITRDAKKTPAKTASTLSLPFQALLRAIEILSGIAYNISSNDASIGRLSGTDPNLFLLDSPSCMRKKGNTKLRRGIGVVINHQPVLPESCNLRTVTLVKE